MARLSLHLLGPWQVICDGASATFTYDKVPALLIYLAVGSDQPHSREVLAELLWPDRPSTTSRHSLSQALTAVRRAIDSPARLILTRETVQFTADSDCWLDTAEFTQLLDACDHHTHPRREACADCAARLEQAVLLYQGEFLAHFSIGDSTGFEDWVTLQRETLHRRAMQALTQLTGYDEARGNLERAIAFARRQLELELWEESAHRQLMRLLALSGQRGAALAQYERCREILAAELGVEPEAETEALYQQMRAGEFGSARAGTPAAQSPATFVVQHNLPVPSTPFVGRETELAKVAALLADPACRMMTLVGPGGIGKTRLAIQTAAGHSDNFAQGAWFVALAPLSSPDLIASAVAETLAFQPYGAETLRAQLLTYLRDQHLLLVLDNFEHLLAGAALLAEVIERAPRVKLLVTSRVRLNLKSEWAFEVEGLSVPASLQTPDADRYGAVQLFEQSARRAHSSFEVRDDNRPHIVRICQLVSGTPLGIELAAAWLPVLSSEEIAREIAHNLDFLASELRDVPERHRSMRAVFDQSWHLLTEPERAAFRRLSAFRGGFSRKAAEVVAGASLVDLSRLAAKSLIHRAASGRYAVHELLRQYGELNLRERSEDEQDTRERHGHFYLDFLATREAALKGPGQQVALADVAGELENIRAAWEWAVASGNAGLIARSISSFWLYTEVQGRYGEAEMLFRLAAEALERAPEGAPDRALALGKALACEGSWYMRLGKPEQLRVMGGQSLALLRPLNARREIAFTLNMMAAAAHVQGDYADERRFLQESITLGRASGDQWITGYSLNDLGLVTFILGGAGEAKRLCAEAVAIFKAIGDQRGMAFALNNLGVVAGQSGEYVEADHLLREGLALWRATNHRWGIATTLTRLGAVARARRDAPAARVCFLEAIQTAMEVRTLPPVLDALVELAALDLAGGNPAQARNILQAVLSHPAGTATTRANAERLRSELNLPFAPSAPEVESLVAALLSERPPDPPPL